MKKTAPTRVSGLVTTWGRASNTTVSYKSFFLRLGAPDAGCRIGLEETVQGSKAGVYGAIHENFAYSDEFVRTDRVC
jgi:hypothetical protein